MRSKQATLRTRSCSSRHRLTRGSKYNRDQAKESPRDLRPWAVVFLELLSALLLARRNLSVRIGYRSLGELVGFDEVWIAVVTP